MIPEARAAVDAARERFGHALRSAYLIGSLAHGGFAPEVSDVDVAFLLEDDASADQRDFDEVKQAVVDQLGTELAQRLSIFWSTRQWLASRANAGRFPFIDQVDLIDHGVLVYGADVRETLPRPSEDELVTEAADFIAARFETGEFARRVREPAYLISLGSRAVVKAVLFPVRFILTAETGRCGANADAVAHYVETRSVVSLVSAAERWREGGLGDDAESLLRAELGGIYDDLGAALGARLRANGDVARAERLQTWVDSLK